MVVFAFREAVRNPAARRACPLSRLDRPKERAAWGRASRPASARHPEGAEAAALAEEEARRVRQPLGGARGLMGQGPLFTASADLDVALAPGRPGSGALPESATALAEGERGSPLH